MIGGARHADYFADSAPAAILNVTLGHEALRAATRPPIAADTYYSAAEVDSRAVPLSAIQAGNPDISGTARGIVVLRLYINSRGTVDNVVIVRAEPYHTFGPSLLLPFRQARFIPAKKAGVAVNSEMLIELRYGPAATTARRSARTQ
ncbi:MAG TPA: TonB family protein [Casimicrobiaceae bacterium]|nr:TonB family protein [Casimicrobiaceae bacterium]